MKPLRAAVLIFFAAYCVTQYAGKRLSPKGEFFPVFSWSLFSTVSEFHTDIGVEIARLGDQRFDPPVNYYEFPQTFPYAANRDTAVGKAAYQLAGLPRTEADFAAREIAFIQRFFPITDAVEFRIVALTYNPIERWRTGEIVERVVLSEHEKGQGS